MSVTTSINPEEVVAVVSPRSHGGVSLFETTETITAANVDAFRSEEAVINAAIDDLQQHGFRILQKSSTTLSIAGAPALYQNVFGTPLDKEKKEVAPDHEVEFFIAPQAPSKKLLSVPEPMMNNIEGIALAEPPVLFESALPPLVPPDPTAYRYLLVPDDLALILKATHVHKLGTTGRGVRVAMIDTGHYAHPFFTYHGYQVDNVVLGPGAVDPSQDIHGHGTGESANIFSLAPDARLIPVKMGIDTTGAFYAAMAQNPRIISNSWGYPIDRPGAVLDPYLRTLEAAVADAVANGIIVCFSAGNGGPAFPGSHPDVISVGGVMVNYPTLDFEASNYASSFDSSIYPGRHVPDLCGLVGRSVGDRAPLIMLPVQLGCYIDITFASPSNRGGPADGTAGNDGWALFSGTSAACPQIAGVAALLLEKDPSLTPAQIKAHLKNSATDVTRGQSGMGDPAGPGSDAATGAGLVNAELAWRITLASLTTKYLVEATPQQREQMVAERQVTPPLSSEFISALQLVLR